MAIRKDIDDMLNILKNGQPPAAEPKKQEPAREPVRTRHDAEIDNMSVDDLLSSLAVSRVITEVAENSVKASAEKPESKPEPAPEPEPKPKKKRIVISGELPDYEAIRARDLEQNRLERERIEAEKQAAEKAERERIRAEKAAEAERKAAEEAAQQRLMAERRAAEKARIDAERKAEIARIAAEKQAAEAARLEAQRKAAEEARLEAERKAAEEARLEAERKAAEEARIEAEKQAAERARLEEERRAEALAKLDAQQQYAAEKAHFESHHHIEYAEKRAAQEAEAARIEEEMRNAVGENLADISAENSKEPTIDELMDAALAAAKAAEAQFLETERAAEELSSYDPVDDLIESIREDAEKAVEELETPSEPETPAEEPVPEPEPAPVEEPEPAEHRPSLAELEAELDDELFGKKKKKLFGRKDAEDAEGSPEKQGKVTSKLHKILDEDPDEIIAGRKETVENGELVVVSTASKMKKTLYTIFGVLFFILACIGLITVIAKVLGFFGSYSSGDTHKTTFREVLYPAVIMDIETFTDPSELPSDQVLTAAIWSMIMSDNAISKYEQTFDVVKIPAADVESYAVKLFGENIPALNHTTVGPSESRFYYNEETQSYNVPVAPITHTYSPLIKSATKDGSSYRVVVNYIDELPSWLPETSSKTVEFTLNETNEGYQIRAMKILSTSSTSL